MKAELIFDGKYKMELTGKQVMMMMNSLEQYFPMESLPDELRNEISIWFDSQAHQDTNFLKDTNDHLAIVTAFNKLLVGHGYLTVDGSELMNYDDFVAYNKTLPKDKRYNLGKDSE